tara:strand:+ start:275 stop:958 length:684 start_codon:yes stop_codon:yes gene_type:complete
MGLKIFFLIVVNELRIASRRPADTLAVLVFFLMGTILFPIGLGPNPKVLSHIAPAILWIMALLAAMLSFDRLFQDDYRDGTLELLMIKPHPIWLTVIAKILVHWLTTGFMLMVVSPIIGITVNLQPTAYLILIVTLALGTGIISLMGALVSALVLGARRVGVLLSLLVIPLIIPALIFGVSAVNAVTLGTPVQSHMLLLMGLFLVCTVICPWGCTVSLQLAASSKNN